jgi:hypothetical protein
MSVYGTKMSISMLWLVSISLALTQPDRLRAEAGVRANCPLLGYVQAAITETGP